MTTTAARLVSITAHPAVLMPLAAFLATPGDTIGAELLTALTCSALALAYSFYRTRRGDWSHIDASTPRERAQLNIHVGAGLLATAGILWLAGIHPVIAIVIGLSGLIIAAGHALRRIAKLSLHVAFAAFAASLVWPNHLATAVLAVVALALCWSRFALRRHVPADIMLGALVGAAAGGAFHAAMAWLPH